MPKRFWEIDAARGIAVVLMVLFNYSFALDYLRIYTITEGWRFWWLFPRLVAGTFILLAGISVTISYSHNNRTKKHLTAAGITVILADVLLESMAFDFPWLLWLGMMPYSFTTLDYFPLLPWLGVFMIGMAVGKQFYLKGKRRFKIKEVNAKIFGFLGRHSLIIYLLH